VKRAIWEGRARVSATGGGHPATTPPPTAPTRLTLLGPTPRRIAPTDKLRAAVNTFLLDPSKGQDGYTVLSPSNIVDSLGPDLDAGPDLERLVIEAVTRPRWPRKDKDRSNTRLDDVR
jgi:hypothetical protein